MLKAVSLFRHKKPSTRLFKDYYIEWIDVLKTTYLPILRHSFTVASSSKLLSIFVDLLHHHFQSYYKALDSAAATDVAQVLFPDWRNPLEKPFLWLGDLHPYIFINLLRSFLQSHDDTGSDSSSPERFTIQIGKSCDFLNSRWPMENAWKDSSENLMGQVDRIECGLRLMVPELTNRAKKAQAKFVERIGTEWGKWEQVGEKAAIREAAVVEMEELVGVFADANRLRSNVLSEIVSATSVDQAALFLEALAQFLVGLRDKNLVKEFEQCKLTVN